MNELRSLTEAANDGFNGCKTDELRAYCKQLGINSRNYPDSKLVEMLTDALADGAATGVIDPAKPAPTPIRAQQGRPLNLRPVGKWEGRRRLVELEQSEHDTKSSWKELAWDQSQIFVQTGREVSIPYPHYEALKNAVYEHVTTVKVRRPDGSEEIQEQIVRRKTFNFRDIGDDPATAHLPTSWIDRQQKDCRANSFYKGKPRNWMVRLLIEMTDGTVSRELLKEYSDEEIREQILNKLGLYEEAQEHPQFFLDVAA